MFTALALIVHTQSVTMPLESAAQAGLYACRGSTHRSTPCQDEETLPRPLSASPGPSATCIGSSYGLHLHLQRPYICIVGLLRIGLHAGKPALLPGQAAWALFAPTVAPYASPSRTRPLTGMMYAILKTLCIYFLFLGHSAPYSGNECRTGHCLSTSTAYSWQWTSHILIHLTLPHLPSFLPQMLRLLLLLGSPDIMKQPKV